MGGHLAPFDPVLRRLRQGAAEYFGSGSASLTPIEVSERRASWLMRAEVRTAADRYQIFVKVYKPRSVDLRSRVERDFSTTLRVHQLTAADAQFGAVYPIACFPEHVSIVTRQAAGVPLSRFLEERAKFWSSSSERTEVAAAMRRVGAWLRRFQEDHGDSEVPRLSDLIQYVDLRLQKLLNAGAITAADAAQVRLRLESLWNESRAEDRRSVPVHADYCLGNVLIDGDRVVVLDFAMARVGTIYHDLAHMYMHMQLMAAKPWFRGRVFEDLGGAMLDGYSAGLTPAAPLFRFQMIYHVVNHLAQLTVRPSEQPLQRPYTWLLRRRHMSWLKGNGCLDAMLA